MDPEMEEVLNSLFGDEGEPGIETPVVEEPVITAGATVEEPIVTAGATVEQPVVQPATQAQTQVPDANMLAQLKAQQDMLQQYIMQNSAESKRANDMMAQMLQPPQQQQYQTQEQMMLDNMLQSQLGPLQQANQQMQAKLAELEKEREAAKVEQFMAEQRAAIETVKQKYPDFNEADAGQLMTPMIEGVQKLGATQDQAEYIVLSMFGTKPDSLELLYRAKAFDAAKARIAELEAQLAKPKPDEHVASSATPTASKSYEDRLNSEDTGERATALNELFGE